MIPFFCQSHIVVFDFMNPSISYNARSILLPMGLTPVLVSTKMLALVGFHSFVKPLSQEPIYICSLVLIRLRFNERSPFPWPCRPSSKSRCLGFVISIVPLVFVFVERHQYIHIHGSSVSSCLIFAIISMGCPQQRWTRPYALQYGSTFHVVI